MLLTIPAGLNFKTIMSSSQLIAVQYKLVSSPANLFSALFDKNRKNKIKYSWQVSRQGELNPSEDDAKIDSSGSHGSLKDVVIDVESEVDVLANHDLVRIENDGQGAEWDNCVFEAAVTSSSVEMESDDLSGNVGRFSNVVVNVEPASDEDSDVDAANDVSLVPML